MNPETNPSVAHDDARTAAARKLGICAPFLNVGDLSKLTGLTGAGIRGQMREGRFPIAHRRMGSIILVKSDDFLDWYLSAPSEVFPERSPLMASLSDFIPRAAASRVFAADSSPLTMPSVNVMPHAETARERVARLKQIATQAVKSKRAV